MYCSRRDCWEDMFEHIDNEFKLCLKHFDAYIQAKKDMRVHSAVNCYCGKDHTQKEENTP